MLCAPKPSMTIAEPSQDTAASGLIAPHGGVLVDLMVPADQRDGVRASADRRVECSDRNACDVELLVVGGFSPLRGFMHQEDYEAVVGGHRTSSGLLFGLPIVFDSDEEEIAIGERLLLTYRGQELAVLTVESRWEPDKVKEAQGCYGTTSLEHPAVRMIAGERGRYYIGGRVQGLELPQRVFPCKTPAEVNNPRIRWAYLPYSMHMAGPREALQHMIIRKNYGCTHFIIGRDMAGCKSSLSGEDFYGPYEAQDFARDHASELGMETVPSLNLVYTEEEGYVTAEHAEARGLHVRKLSGTQFRQMLRGGEEIPEWFAFRSVVEVLRAAA